MTNETKDRVLLYLILAVAIIFFIFAYKVVKIYENGLASLSATQVYVCSCEAPKVEKKVSKPVSKPIVKPTPKPQPQPVPEPIGPLPFNGPAPNPTYNPFSPSGPTYEPQTPIGPLPSN